MSVHSRAPRGVPGSYPLAAHAVRRLAPLGLAAAVLCGCGGGNDSPAAPDPTIPVPPPSGEVRRTVEGTVAGLAAGQSVVLQNQGADDYAVSANGPFVTAASWPLGSSYAITVKTQPTGQQCMVTRGEGTLSTAPMNVRVDCVELPDESNTLGGTVSGIPGGQTVVLSSGTGEDIALTADGGFTFATPLANGAGYSVTVKAMPAGFGCVVRNGLGSVAAAVVDTVAVRCAPQGILSEGSWEQDECLAVPGSSGGLRDLWRIVPAASSVSVGAGMVTYRNPQCSGIGSASPGPLNGTFSFDQERTEATAELAAFWGSRRYIATSMAPTKVVLVRKVNHLCLLEDKAVPSVYPDPASLGPAVTAAVAAGKCYTPR